MFQSLLAILFYFASSFMAGPSEARGDPFKRFQQKDRIPFSGTVIYQGTDQPVEEYIVSLKRWDEDKASWQRIMSPTWVRNPKGRFSFPLEKTGRYALEIAPSRFHEGLKKEGIEVPATKGLTDLCLEVSGLHAVGRVLDDRTGQPVEKALLVPLDPQEINDGPEKLMSRLEQFRSDLPESLIHTVTNGEGEFLLSPGLGPTKLWTNVIVYHPDFVPAVGFIDPRSPDPMEIRLETGYRIQGRVLDDSSQPLPGAVVTLVQPRTLMTYTSRAVGHVIGGRSGSCLRHLPSLPVFTGEDGTFQIPPARPGTVTVIASLPKIYKPETFDFTEETRVVEITDRNVKVDFGPSPGHVTWRGRVSDEKGIPASEILITAERAGSARKAFHFVHWTVADEKGAFTLRKLEPGSYHVGLEPRRGGPWIHWGEINFDHAGEVVRNLTLPGGSTDDQGPEVEPDQRGWIMIRVLGLSFKEWMKAEVKVQGFRGGGLRRTTFFDEQVLPRSYDLPGGRGFKACLDASRSWRWRITVHVEGVWKWTEDIGLEPGETREVVIHLSESY